MTAWRSWGAAQRGPFRPFELEQARRGAAAGLPTRALPQPARWVASDQTGSQPHYHGHPIRPGVVPPGHQSTVGKGVGCAASQAGLASPPGRVPPHRHLARPLDAELLRQDAQGHGGTRPPRHGVGSAPHTPAEETSLEALPSFCLGLGAAAGSLANGWLSGPTHREWGKKTKPLSPGVEVSGARSRESLQSL